MASPRHRAIEWPNKVKNESKERERDREEETGFVCARRAHQH